MKLVLYDPSPPANLYLSRMYFLPMLSYAQDNKIKIEVVSDITNLRDAVLLVAADYLDGDTVDRLKANGCKTVGFSISDSSYPVHACNFSRIFTKIDLLFMVTGLQTKNEGSEFVIDKDFNVVLETRKFMPDYEWHWFNGMRDAGRLQSLPYVHWHEQAQVPSQPYSQRSQKALIRGGHHMRRFILALFLTRDGLLDTNSGFVTKDYFKEEMNPQFRYCDPCRIAFKQQNAALYHPYSPRKPACRAPEWNPEGGNDLGRWNNCCPDAFFGIAERFMERHGMIAPPVLEKLLNARWLSQEEHLGLLGRITFTSDCKWLFSIYAAQRFWDAAMMGCINFLPSRTMDQEYFPRMTAGQHYLTFDEKMDDLGMDMDLTEGSYRHISENARQLYDEWMRPTKYAIGTKLLEHIFERIGMVL